MLSVSPREQSGESGDDDPAVVVCETAGRGVVVVEVEGRVVVLVVEVEEGKIVVGLPVLHVLQQRLAMSGRDWQFEANC